MSYFDLGALLLFGLLYEAILRRFKTSRFLFSIEMTNRGDRRRAGPLAMRKNEKKEEIALLTLAMTPVWIPDTLLGLLTIRSFDETGDWVNGFKLECRMQDTRWTIHATRFRIARGHEAKERVKL